jgi:formate-dependent phosphoribosylglycinamide formyltransferase (GAR transformylase)
LAHRFRYGAFRPLRALQLAISQSDADLIIPCDERTVRHLHRLQAETSDPVVRALIERSLGAPHGYATATTRHDLLTLANDQGVTTPESVLVNGLADLKGLVSTRPFPWVMKADGSWAGLGVRIVRSLAEAEEAYSSMNRRVTLMLTLREAFVEHDFFWFAQWFSRSRPAISIQRYVVGRPANCAVACWKGEVVGATAVEVVNAESETGPSTVVRVVDNQTMVDAAQRVVSSLGMSGLVGFDFMVETETGVPYMIEMNPRNTPICHVRLGGTHDLVEALVARAAGRLPVPYPPVTEHDIIVFFPHTWKADPTSPYLHIGYHDIPWDEPSLVRELVKPHMRERYWIMRLLRRIWLGTRNLRRT